MSAEQDLELEAMAAIRDALKPLDAETLKRVLDWANRRFRPPIGSTALGIADATSTGSIDSVQVSATFEDLPSLVDAANPGNGLDRILVVAYWFQQILKRDDFDAFAINRELKHLGYPAGNITRDLESLISRTPRLVIQTRKLGSTKQARKQYKLTREGVRAVDEMLRGQTHD